MKYLLDTKCLHHLSKRQKEAYKLFFCHNLIISYAAQAPTIDEATKVSGLLVAVAAAIFIELKQDTNQAQLEAIAEGILRERTTLFQIANTSTVNDLSISIDIKPQILNVSGFPIILKKGQDPIKDVEAQIRRKDL